MWEIERKFLLESDFTRPPGAYPKRIVQGYYIYACGGATLYPDGRLEVTQDDRYFVAQLSDRSMRKAARLFPSVKRAETTFLAGAAEVRARSVNGGEPQLTLKVGTGLCRVEFDFQTVPKATLTDLAELPKIEKLRYAIPYKGSILEVNEYSGMFASLKVMEVEFPDAAAAAAFDVPKWVVKEVTDDLRYSNYYLASLSNQVEGLC